jgi:hypothetical protein
LARNLSRVLALGAVVAMVILTSVPARAHHAISAEFDVNKPITFTGTVKKVDWMNPHIYTHIEAKDESGRSVVYKVEGGPPNALFRAGWRPDSLKVGETVTVKGVKAKNANSTNIGQATITTADGKSVYGRGGGNNNQ